MKNKSFAQLIRLSDFEQIRHTIFLKNETSQTSFVHDGQIILKEMGATYMIMEGPTGCCQFGHQLTLSLTPSDKSKLATPQSNKQLVQIIARVESYQPLADTTRAVWVARFTQFNAKEWNKIIECYQQQQRKIDQLIGSQQKL